jgi:hypothetical protein
MFWFSSEPLTALNFQFICVLILFFFLSFSATFCFSIPDYRLIRITSINPDYVRFAVVG